MIKEQFTKLVPVTAAEAAEWLKTSKGNRRLRRSQVEYLKREIDEDRWVPVETVVFDTDGSLVDGHHRLTAQVECGKTLIHNVTRNAPVIARSVIDTGNSRSAADVWSISTGDPLSSRKAAIVRTLIYVLTGKPSKISVHDIERVSSALGGGVEFAAGLPRKKKFSALFGAAIAMAYQINPAKVQSLITAIAEENTPEGTPGAAIRVLMGQPKRGEYTLQIVRKFMRGVGAHLKDEKLQQLKDGSGLEDLLKMRKAAGVEFAAWKLA